MFDLSQLRLSGLPSVPLSALHDLPSCRGVYFATIPDGTVLYIGRTRDISKRWSKHHRYAEIAAWENVSISWLQFDGDTALLDEIERACIEHFAPLLNGRKDFQRKPRPAGLWLRWRVREFADARGLNITELAREAGITANTARALYRGVTERVDFDTLVKVAKALGVRPMELLEEVEEPQGPFLPVLIAA